MEIHDLIRRAVGASLGIVFLSSVAFGVDDGYVVKVDSDTVYVDWGTGSGVIPGDSFSIYREGAPLKHPVTGKSLGRAPKNVGTGVIDSVRDKFSVGKILDDQLGVKSGDRTHHNPPPAWSSEAAPGAYDPRSPEDSTTTLRMLWQSEPIPSEITSIAFGDLDGDRKKEIIVASRDRIEVFQGAFQRLASVARFKSRAYQRWVSVEAADLEKAGRDKVFATNFVDGLHRGRVVVMSLSSSTLVEESHLDGFVRALPRSGGVHSLAWMGLAMSRDLHVLGPAELVHDGNRYKAGPALALPKLQDEQLFGYAVGRFNQDSTDDFAVLERGDQLRVYFGQSRWTASQTFGGTRNDIALEGDQAASILPRLAVASTGSRADVLIAPKNIPELGVRTRYLKLFKRSELVGLKWNGSEMVPAWREPLEGYLADFGVADLDGNGRSELWVALAGPRRQTVLRAYELP
jgi:hypothetical protein